MEEYSKEKLYKYAIWLLSKRDYSQKEMSTKLSSKSTNIEDISNILQKIIELGFIDDKRRAGIIYEQYKRKYGWLKIKQKLITKGISEEIINELKNIDTDSDGQECYELILKKFKQYNKEQELIVWKYLMSKGYEHKKIKSCLTRFREENSE